MKDEQLKAKLRKVQNSIRRLNRKLLKKLIIEKQLKDELEKYVHSSE